MIHSILGILEKQHDMEFKIKGIILAGMVTAPSLLETLQQMLSIPYVENVYGMTEGAFVTAGMVDNIENI